MISGKCMNIVYEMLKTFSVEELRKASATAYDEQKKSYSGLQKELQEFQKTGTKQLQDWDKEVKHTIQGLQDRMNNLHMTGGAPPPPGGGGKGYGGKGGGYEGKVTILPPRGLHGITPFDGHKKYMQWQAMARRGKRRC